MRFSIALFFCICFMESCSNNDNTPDVSNVKVELATLRFEKDFFALDTLQLMPNLTRLLHRYPSFGENFLTTILNTDPTWRPDSAALYIGSFISAYKNVFDTSQKLYRDFSPYEKQIKKAVQYLKHYFPKYPSPTKIITYIGPLDGYGDILDSDAFIIGLHHHLGSDFPMYKTEMVRTIYPDYISARFTPDFIVINCMKNVVLDMYAEKIEDKTLVIQMVEKGRRLYLLQKLVPFVKEYQVIGYTEKQFTESLQREAIIWDLFVQNNFLQSIDNNTIKNYIGESPKTMELGEASPGNIGSFCGWQIVKKYMNTFPETTLEGLMNTDPEIIFQKAKYKP